MSQTAITLVFEQWKAQQASTGESVLLDEFVFALVPGLDPALPVDRSETLPPAAQIVHRAAVARKGVVNENAVVHSAVLGADVGDFSFNWIGLINKASGTLAMIVHAPVQQKLKTKEGQQGNVLTRSFLMEFTGAQTETAINTPAETWQIDFTARLAGMDERQRLENIDIYGAGAFFGDGYLVGKTGNQYFVTQGAGYVAGLRAQLAANQNITVTTRPVKVWLDVSWTGTLTSVWGVQSKVTVATTLADYEQDGVKHYVFALASIDENGNITDLRPAGGLNDQALREHEKSRNHPDATTKEKGFVQLSSATDSASEAHAATPKAVKAANDNANGRVPSGRKVNGRELSQDIDITAQDIFNGQAIAIGDAVDLNTLSIPGLYYQGADVQAASGKNYPEAAAGSLEIYKHAGITQVYRVYYSSTTYIRTLYNGAWSAWAKQYDTANKPAPADIGAVSEAGGNYNATFKLGRIETLATESNMSALYNTQAGVGGVVSGVEFNWYGQKFTVGITRDAGTGTNGLVFQHNGYTRLTIDKNGNLISIGNISTPNNMSATYISSVGDIRSERNISSKGIIEAGGGLYDTPGVRAYSPNNPPPQQDLSPYALQSWVVSYFVQAIRFGASGEYKERGNNEHVNGGVMTSFADMGSSNYWIRIRPLQYLINGAWVTAAYS